MTPIPPSPQNSAQFLKHTRRRKLTVEDFNRALRWSNVEVGDPPPPIIPMIGIQCWGPTVEGPIIAVPLLSTPNCWGPLIGSKRWGSHYWGVPPSPPLGAVWVRFWGGSVAAGC